MQRGTTAKSLTPDAPTVLDSFFNYLHTKDISFANVYDLYAKRIHKLDNILIIIAYTKRILYFQYVFVLYTEAL